MLTITKETNDINSIEYEDARSRVAIWAINHADSPEISRLGDLTFLPTQGGFSNHNGSILINTREPGINVSRVPQLSDTNYLMVPGYPVAPLRMPVFYNSVDTCCFEDVLSEMLGGINYIAMAQKLNLYQIDMDSTYGKLTRSHIELTGQLPDFSIPYLFCGNANWSMINVYTYLPYRNIPAGCEVKFFKYKDAPGIFPFFFKPCKSGVSRIQYDLTAKRRRFSTALPIVRANRNIDWICTAGGAENLDWEIFRNTASEIILPYYPSDQLFNRTAFAEIWPVLTESKRHNIKIQIRQVTAKEIAPHNAHMTETIEESKTSIINENELKKRAHEYGIKLDPVWKIKPYEIVMRPKDHPNKLPYFWNNGFITLFEGTGVNQFMLHLLRLLLSRQMDNDFECSTPESIVIVVQCGYEGYIKKCLHCLSQSPSISIVNSEIMEQDSELESFLIEKRAKALFFYVSDNNCVKEFTSGLRLAVVEELHVAIFSGLADENTPFRPFADQTYFVKTANTKPGVWVKDMTTGKISQYLFDSAGNVTISPGTEADMVK